MKKTIAVCILLFITLSLVSCNTKTHENMFRVSIENPQLQVQKGETVTYTARLYNLTEKELQLSHGIPLISLSVRGTDNNNTPEGNYAVQVSSTINVNDFIEKEINIEFLETGPYTLKASSFFTIDGKDYNISCEDVIISAQDS